MLADTSFERAKHLCNLTSPSKFQKNYLDTLHLILNSNNEFYINNTNKKHLVKLKAPMERSMLRYLLFFDQDILAFKNNKKNISVFMKIFGIQFGQVQMSHQHMKEM